jgi:CheY-like chemotaxis protein
MGTTQTNQTMRMAAGGIHLLSSRQPRSLGPALCTQVSDEAAVQRRSSHVLKVMVVVTGQERSDGFELVMRRWGYEVGAAHDGPAALEMARATQPDVVIVEVESPRFCRCRLAGRVRNELASTDGLIIAVTKQSNRECRRQCREAGIDVVLCIPVDSAVLETLLWMENTRLKRMRPDIAGGPGRRAERPHEHEWVDPFLVGRAEVTYQQMATLERIREAAGQTS